MKPFFKGVKGIITLILVIAIFLIGYFIHDGYELYREAVDAVSIEAKVADIQKIDGYTKLSELPKEYKDAVIAIEDKRFYEHFGLDFYSIGRALMNNIGNKKIMGGGSTITQQLAKNMYFDQKKKITRKVAEVFVSLDLEERYSKDEILELYLNIIYFGDGYYGIHDASYGYLKKSPSEMDLNESTLLAGLPNAPSVYQLSNNSKYTYQRQIMVIKAMVEKGTLDTNTANALIDKIRKEKGIN